MRLSILIPMYNAKDYIGNCIESLLHQNISKDDYEIIIMDDGSSDNSVEIIEHYTKQYKNIKLHKEPNSGAFATRNKLLKLAKGDYIYNLDADDYIVHNCLGQLLQIAENNQLDIIGFDTIETSKLDKKSLVNTIEDDTDTFSSGKVFIEEHPHHRYEIWWYFIKKNFMLEHQMMFNNNQYNADVIFTLEALLKAPKIGFVKNSIHRYVQTEGSLMRSKDFKIISKRIEYLQMMIGNTSQLINSLKRDNNSERLINNIKHRRDVFTFFNLISMLRNPFGLKYIKSKIQDFKTVNAYPIKDFNKHRYNTLLYRVLRYIVNNETIFYTLISIKNIFYKPVK